MTLDFTHHGKMVVNMRDYVTSMIEEFSTDIGHMTETTPAADDLFSAPSGALLDPKRKEEFHTMVAKGLFLCKRARPDIHTTISVLCTRVKAPTESDWKRLVRLMKYLNGTRSDDLILSTDDTSVVKWFVDASFAVHPDFRSHTGGMMTLGRGAVQSLSKKQKLNTKSSTEAELVGADDASVLLLWTKLFLAEQGYTVNDNILYQDNKSTILLQENGKRSSGSRTRALNIRYFFLTDQIEKGNVRVIHCPTGEMVADYLTKPLQGKTFTYLKKKLMGHD
jgi:hypothetical protein